MNNEYQNTDQKNPALKKTPLMVTGVKTRLYSSIITKSENENKSEEQVKAELSLFLNVSVQQIGWWVNNTRQPSLEQAYNIALFFGRKLDEIVYASN